MTSSKHKAIAQAIGMMRQWLNEDRIKDAKRFVTNEQLHSWLDEAIEAAIKDLLVEAEARGRLLVVEAALRNLSRTSRTANGVVDTSASADKADRTIKKEREK